MANAIAVQGMRMTADAREALISTHRNNINGYCRLLATELTDHERQFIHKRIAEERLELERLVLSTSLGEKSHSQHVLKTSAHVA